MLLYVSLLVMCLFLYTVIYIYYYETSHKIAHAQENVY